MQKRVTYTDTQKKKALAKKLLKQGKTRDHINDALKANGHNAGLTNSAFSDLRVALGIGRTNKKRTGPNKKRTNTNALIVLQQREVSVELKNLLSKVRTALQKENVHNISIDSQGMVKATIDQEITFDVRPSV